MKTIDYTEPYVYSITVCTANKNNIFSNKDRAQIAMEVISNYSKRFDVICYACCVMPDHIHLALRPDGKCPVVDFVGFLKGRISYVLSRGGQKGKIWQRGFYDHVLRLPEKLEDLVMYILENPVRKGLVDSFQDYPWSFDSFGIKDGPKRKSE